MSIALSWIASVYASAVNAAATFARGKQLADLQLRDAFSLPAAIMRDEIANSLLLPDRMWSHLLAWSYYIENNRVLATTAILKTVTWPPRHESLADRLDGRIAAVEAALLRTVPG